MIFSLSFSIIVLCSLSLFVFEMPVSVSLSFPVVVTSSLLFTLSVVSSLSFSTYVHSLSFSAYFQFRSRHAPSWVHLIVSSSATFSISVSFSDFSTFIFELLPWYECPFLSLMPMPMPMFNVHVLLFSPVFSSLFGQEVPNPRIKHEVL